MQAPQGSVLGTLSAADFLARYWQKQPCLIRGALPDFRSLLSKKELFALSMEEAVESRLVLERGGEMPWEVIHGPQDPEDLAHLPDSYWTLLVQNVDLHRREAAEFLRRFRFIPDWRIDDLMISVAPAGGSVGPHLDSYDVFLLQAYGRRRWQINRDDYTEDDFIPGLDLRILGDFRPQQEWVLEAGDMLYLPPGVAHHGVALDECLTYSIGFRAPSRQELLHHYLDDMLMEISDETYCDPDLMLQESSAEITTAARSRIRSLLQTPFLDEAALDRWFGCYVTRLPDQIDITPPARMDSDTFARFCSRVNGLCCHHVCRTVFIRRGNDFILFVNGVAYTVPGEHEAFMTALTGARELDQKQLRDHAGHAVTAAILQDLYNRGLLHEV
jgi:50S ribosomal protein L16 3-hydroxylase